MFSKESSLSFFYQLSHFLRLLSWSGECGTYLPNTETPGKLGLWESPSAPGLREPRGLQDGGRPAEAGALSEPAQL